MFTTWRSVLVDGVGGLGVEGQVMFGAGRCYKNTTRYVADGAVTPHGCKVSCWPSFGPSKAIMWASATTVRIQGSCNLFDWYLSIWRLLRCMQNSKAVRISSEQDVLSVFHMLTETCPEVILPFCKILDHEGFMPSLENGLPQNLCSSYTRMCFDIPFFYVLS
jgi:hypothetical protein